MTGRFLSWLFGRGAEPAYYFTSDSDAFRHWREARGRPMFPTGSPKWQRYLDEIEYDLEGRPGEVFVKYVPPIDPRVLDFP